MIANGLGDQCSISCQVIVKTQKWYLMPPCLALRIIRYVSRVKWSNLEKEVVSSQHLGVVAIEKGSFGSPSTTVGQHHFFTMRYLILKFVLFSNIWLQSYYLYFQRFILIIFYSDFYSFTCIVMWNKVSSSYTNNLYTIIWFQVTIPSE